MRGVNDSAVRQSVCEPAGVKACAPESLILRVDDVFFCLFKACEGMHVRLR